MIVTLNNGDSSAPGPGSGFQYVDTSPAGGIPSVTGVIPSGGLETAPAAVTILGAGFTGGDARSPSAASPPRASRVHGPNRDHRRPPRRTPRGPRARRCPSTGVFAGENAANDICQVQVRVSNADGASAAGHILPPPEGTFAIDNAGRLVPPPGCDCEHAPAPTEYDYVPAPRVTSVSTSRGPASLASEAGTRVITVRPEWALTR